MCPQVMPPSGTKCVEQSGKCVTIDNPDGPISHNYGCRYCGNTCTQDIPGLKCLDVLPPEGKKCVFDPKSATGCSEVTKTNTNCGWCGNTCRDMTNVNRNDCPLIKTLIDQGKCVENSAGQCVVIPPIIVPSSFFVDVPTSHWAYTSIKSIYENKVTSGCSSNPLKYCPEDKITRVALATMLAKAKYGANYHFTGDSTIQYADIASSSTAKPYVDKLYQENIIAGCSTSPLKFCPDQEVSREVMALLIYRLKYGLSVPSVGATPIFQDVATNSNLRPYIEKLYQNGLIAGCSTNPRNFCPTRTITRAEAAVFIHNAFYNSTITPNLTPPPTLNCGYCGQSCINLNNKMMCPMIAPPAGKSCIEKSGACVEVDDLTARNCTWCGLECIDSSRVKPLMCDKIAPPKDKICTSENGKCVIKDGTLIEKGKVVFSPDSTSFYGDSLSVSLSILPADPDYKIFYTIDSGTEATYSKAFSINKTSIVNVRATASGKPTLSGQKTYTKLTLPVPTALKNTCINNGSSVTFEWTGSTTVPAYLVALYDSTGSKVSSKIVTTSKVDFVNIQATEKYSKWTVQPLHTNSDSSTVIKDTKHLEVTGTTFQCVIPAPDVPTVGRVPTMTNLFSMIISGKKPAGSSILLNGTTVIGATASTDWSYELKFDKLGANKFEIWSFADNKNSGKIYLEVHRCKFGDLNCDTKINITDFAWFVKAMLLSKTSDEKFEFMELADMNNGEGAKGNGSLDIQDFTKFRDVYIQNVGK
jgi:hypothetical protein